jgi:4-amino-4-deoxy-L-arabinose transferase-like glycosyltransferase
MVSVSLFVELLRHRPLSLFWSMAGLQVALWTLIPFAFYSAPPGHLPLVLSIGHDFRLGTDFGPPLAFWLAEIAYRAAGMFGVYLLSQLCIVATFWAVLSLGRAIVGDAYAVAAVLLMAGIAVFSVPTPEFGPAILAAPLWALLLAHYWRAAQRDDLRYWIAAGVDAGLLLLTTYAGLILVGLVIVFMLASKAGRRHLENVGPWIAGLIVIFIQFPTLIWLDLTGGTSFIGFSAVLQNLRTWLWLIAALVVSHAGLAILVVLCRGYLFPSRAMPPEIVRRNFDKDGRIFVYFFALAPVLAIGLFSFISHRPENFISAPLAAMSGLAIVVAAGERIRIEHQYLIGYVWAAVLITPPILVALFIAVQPWLVAADLRVNRPAHDIGVFFSDNFQRRTGNNLEIVGGDLQTATLIALAAPARPRIYHEAREDYLPVVTREQMDQKGAILVWPAADAAGRPPPEIARQFPNLVVEVPYGFTQRFQGRMPLYRIGWAMIRPRGPDMPALPEPGPLQPLPPAPPEQQWQLPSFTQPGTSQRAPVEQERPIQPVQPDAAPPPQPRFQPPVDRHGPQ